MDKSIIEVVHESAKDLHDAGHLDAQTMREFDALCLPPVEEYNWKDIKKIRVENGVSQAVFAAYLNTSVATIRKWEASGEGHNRPNGLAMKMLNLINKYGIVILGEESEMPERDKAPIPARGKAPVKRSKAALERRATE
jgi:putative transcriptional regulator